jgi:hypothetical protein
MKMASIRPESGGKEKGANSDSKSFQDPMPKEIGDEASIRQVREILFGRRLQEQEEKFLGIQSKFDSDTKSVRSEILSRLNDLEAFFKAEIRGLSERANRESESREKALEVANAEAADLRQLILGRTKSLSEELYKEHERFSAETKKTFNQFEKKKMDRTLLIELLNACALRIEGEDGAKSDRQR